MDIEPYGCSSRRFFCWSGRRCTAWIWSPGASSARAAVARMTPRTSSRMAEQTWGATIVRATPCSGRPGHQLCPDMQRRLATAVVCLTFALACARSDLGAACHLQDANGGEMRALPGRDYIYLGSSECESFACLATSSSNGYCSQACSG